MAQPQIFKRIAALALLTLALLALVAGAGCSAGPPKPSPARQHTSAGSGSPDALLADAMRRHNQRQNPAQVLALVKAAAEKAPRQADIAWLYSQLCGQVPSCDAEPAEAQVRRLDPDNGAAWLGALARARQQRDVAAENEILDAMSRSSRFDIYWNPLVSRLALIASADTAARLGPTVPDLVTTSLSDVIGGLSNIVVPAFSPLADTCSSNRMTNPQVAQRCRALANVLVRGDSYIAESVGLGIAERATRPGSPDAQKVAQQIVRSRYQRDTAGTLISAQLERDKFSRELIALMSKLRREQDVYLAVIRWAGQPIEPPTPR